MHILKFGGTSVGKPERMKKIAELIDDGKGKVIVLSALSGTTNALMLIAEALGKGDRISADSLIDGLLKHYHSFVRALYATEEGQTKAAEIIETHFGLLREMTQKEPFTRQECNTILAQGELMSTQLFTALLEEQGKAVQLLPALEFMSKNAHGEPDLEAISAKLKAKLKQYPDILYFVTQGYICLNYQGEVDNLMRGGSDYTATLIGAALQAEEVQIWTDIDGMHNNDPRIVDKTYPIGELSFDEAAELAYFGAKILHPQTVLPAKGAGVPVRLKNTMAPEKAGTLISDKIQEEPIKAVAAKDGITAIKIKSGRMLMAYGFMRRIFEIFEKYKTSVDMVTTSEVGVSITVDSSDYLTDIVRELKELGHVEVDSNQSIVCIVGYMPKDEKNVLNRIFQALGDISVRMVSYGGSKYNVSLLIDGKDKERTLKALNKDVFGI